MQQYRGSKIKVLKQNDEDHQQEDSKSTKSSLNSLKKSAETTKAKFIDLAKQGRILSMKELNMKKRLRFGLTQSSSEIFKSSKMQEDDKNPKLGIEYKLDLKDVMTRSPSVPDLRAVALPTEYFHGGKKKG